MLEALIKCKLFADMSKIEIEQCMTSFHYQIKKYAKGEIVVNIQESVLQQLILIKGSVKSEMYSYNGKTIKIADMNTPRLLAPGYLFGNQSYYPISISATENCEIMNISKLNFLNALQHHVQLQLNFINLISNQTQFLTKKINFLNFKTIKGKIAYFLFTQYKRQDTIHIVLPQSQTQLSDLFGVTRPSLSRAMNDLSHQGIISINGKFVDLLDLEALKKYLA